MGWQVLVKRKEGQESLSVLITLGLQVPPEKVFEHIWTLINPPQTPP